jgi:ABC-2 type transport system permease protein
MNGINPSLKPAPDARILPAVWKLIRLRLRISWNSFRHAKLGSKLGMLFLWLLIFAFAYFLLFLSRFLLGIIRSPEFIQSARVDLQSFLTSLPALTLTTLFFGALLTSFGVLLQALYLAGDMDFLLATPVPIRAVFIAKLFQAVLPNFALVALFGIPILFGLGITSGYHAIYYPLVITVMIVLALAAAGLGSLLVMLAIRVLPPRRAAEVLGFIGAMFGFFCSQMGNFASSFGRDMDISGARLSSLLLLSNTRWLPLNWAGQGLAALGEGQWLSGTLLVGATFGFAIVAFWLAVVTSERLYYSGWAGMQVVARKQITTSPRPVSAITLGLTRGLARLLPQPVLAIVQKDFLTLRRDLRNLSQLIAPVIFGAMYTLILLRSGEPLIGHDAASTWFISSFRIALTYGNVGMSLFVGWMLLSRLAGMGFSQEGRNYWMLKVSPVPVRHLLASKFLVAYVPSLGFGMIFLTVISVVQRLSVLEFTYSLITISMCLAGMTGLLLSFGTAGANLTWDDPRKMNGGVMGCLGQILSMLYLPISFGLFIVPLGVAQFLEFPMLYGYLTGLIFGSGVAAGFTFIPLWLVRKRVERLGGE